jgi:hypothetical protein
MTVFEFFVQFFFQNVVFKLQKDFSGHGIRVFLEETWKLPDIFNCTDLRQTRCAKNIPKTILKTRLKTKETTYTLVS